MLKAQAIGVGAAGNKGIVALVNEDVISQENTLLVNSTLRDIPDMYKNHADLVVNIGTEELSGCGKERTEGKRLALTALQGGKLNLDEWIKPDTKLVIIVTSTEGGTGSGASVIIAKYLRDVLHVNVHVFAFTGFEEDARGLLNTLEFFKDMKEDFTVEIVRNKKFVQLAGNNYPKAEAMANHEFAVRISMLLGNVIIPSDTNMDDTDLEKVATNTGYMDIQYKELTDKLKNVSQFNDFIRDMIDNSKGMDINSPSQTLLGVIINIPDEQRDAIDYKWTEIISRYGEPFESFRHIQYDNSIKPFVAFIATGMKMPIKEIQEVYDKYIDRTSKVNKDRDDFLENLSDLDINTGDDMFNLRNKNKKTGPSERDKSSFFSGFDLESPNVPNKNFSNNSVKSDKGGMSAY